MANTYFRFKQFTIHQDRCAMKVTTDGCLFGAWASRQIRESGSNTQRLLDIGTGTGLLSLMLAQQNECAIEAVEIDEDACQQAKENVLASPWKERISVVCADIRNPQPHTNFDIIISNPPFYENELKSGDERKNIAHHGDQLSITELLEKIRTILAPAGHFFILIPYKRWQEVQEELKEKQLVIRNAVLVRQSIKHEPFRVMICGTLESEIQTAVNVTEISVWDEQRQYTASFQDLLSPYYLAL